MKLAFLTATFPCLTETFVLREWDFLRRDDALDVHVFSIREARGYSRIGLPGEVDVHYIRPDHWTSILCANLWFPLRHPGRAWRSLKLLVKELWKQPLRMWSRLVFQLYAGNYLGMVLKRQSFDVIHGHFASASSIGMFAHLASDIPFSYTVYANGDLFSPPTPFFEEKVRFCRHVVTDTEYNRRMINLLTDFKYEEKVRVIYTGLDLDAFSEVRPLTGFHSPLRLLSVGSMSGFKGYPTVLEALKQVKDAGVEFEYRVVGGGNADVLERLIKQYELDDCVHLLGAQTFEAVRGEFDWCDIFLMASEIKAAGCRDGFPTVIAEAMLSQRLVISTYISDIPNNVVHGETGLIVAEKNPGQLATAIQYALEHPDECRNMIANASRMAREKYDAAENYRELAAVLNG